MRSENRLLRNGFPRRIAKARKIGAGIDLNTNQAVAAVALVELRQPFPDFGCPGPDDGIDVGVVVWPPAEDIDSNEALLEEFNVSCEALIDDVLQKIARLPAGSKWSALTYLRKSLLNEDARELVRA
ncbi:hypothetical protein DYQ86_24510 [Acidobacteria bacterium AB60]|nr:hypothetical protein DYQ86_24510 [Acidobacteria bacterium AB60]